MYLSQLKLISGINIIWECSTINDSGSAEDGGTLITMTDFGNEDTIVLLEN